jgi:hypothetical protein
MAIKTFTTGEVLTASDTNTYLANSGLVYITSGALSSTATNFVGCFTSTYTDYRIVIDSAGVSAAGDFYYQFLSGTTPNTTANYYWYMTGLGHTGGASNSNGAAQTIGYTGISFSASASNAGAGILDCYMPTNASTITYCTSTANGYLSLYYNRTGGSALNVTAAYDGIRFLTNAATTFSGNVTIYGYRKA